MPPADVSLAVSTLIKVAEPTRCRIRSPGPAVISREETFGCFRDLCVRWKLSQAADEEFRVAVVEPGTEILHGSLCNYNPLEGTENCLFFFVYRTRLQFGPDSHKERVLRGGVASEVG